MQQTTLDALVSDAYRDALWWSWGVQDGTGDTSWSAVDFAEHYATTTRERLAADAGAQRPNMFRELRIWREARA